MKKNFIRELTEAAISTTDLALNVEGMSEAIQSMIEKITNIKTKDLAVLVKKIKYDNDIQKADDFQNNIGGKLDQLIQSMTEIKGEIDNVTVGMLNGNDSFDTGSEKDAGLSDLDNDFAEFNPNEESGLGGEEQAEPAADETAEEDPFAGIGDIDDLGSEDNEPVQRKAK